jgi:hypothetical protein
MWEWLILSDSILALFECISVTVHLEDVNVVGEATLAKKRSSRWHNTTENGWVITGGTRGSGLQLRG